MQSSSPVSPVSGRGGLIGRTLGGNYLIERKISDGGMGTVYAARHTRLPATFAVKVLHRDLYPSSGESDEVFQRFRQEAEITSSLRHPHIVQVLDYNRLPDGTIYLVMEYLDGEDLHARIRRQGRLPLAEVLPMARQISSALGAAHKHNVVHRDLKPQNLFLCQQDHGERIIEVVKVLDFGISKIRRPAGPDETGELTRAGRLLGTPQFMAPEQAAGQNHLIDARTDQFALGSILYYALSGQMPFSANDLAAVLFQVLYIEPPPLHLVAPVPQEVGEVVARAMAKQPEKRHASVAELLRALEVAAQGTMMAPSQTDRRAQPGPPPRAQQHHHDESTVLVPVPSLTDPQGPPLGPGMPSQKGLPTPSGRSGLPLGPVAFAPPASNSGRSGLSLPPGPVAFVPPASDSTRRVQLGSGVLPVTTLSGSTGTMEHAATPSPRRSGAPRRPASFAMAAALLISVGTTVWILGPRKPGVSSTAVFLERRQGAPAYGKKGQSTDPFATAGKPRPPGAPALSGAAGEFDRLLLEEDALRQKEDLAGARRALSQALRLYPQSPRARAAMGRLEMEAHNFAEAQRWLREATAAEPDNANHHLWLCQARFRLKDRSGARASCARALHLDPSLTDATLILRGIR